MSSKVIDTVAEVDEHGLAQVQLPPGIGPGEVHLRVTIVEEPDHNDKSTVWPPQGFVTGPLPGWPAESRFSRDELYDDDGR